MSATDSAVNPAPAAADRAAAAPKRARFDGRYFARPARTLFNDVRTHFALSDQLLVWRVIERNITLAKEFLSRLPDTRER